MSYPTPTPHTLATVAHQKHVIFILQFTRADMSNRKLFFGLDMGQLHLPSTGRVSTPSCTEPDPHNIGSASPTTPCTAHNNVHQRCTGNAPICFNEPTDD